MDPLSAIGLASNVIQFVEFAGKLIGEAQEAYESAEGVSLRNANVENIANDLLSLHQQLKRDACRTPGSTASAAEEQLQRLVAESTQIAEKLIQIVQGLRGGGHNRRWTSVRHALASAWKQKDITVLKARLGEIRQQLDTTLLICVRERINNADEYRLRHTRRQSDGSLLLRSEIKQQHQELLQAIRDCGARLDEDQIVQLSARLDASAELGVESQFCKRILAHLEFQEIQDRYERIDPAHRSTFEWIFKKPDDSHAEWADFPQWLAAEDDGNFYWMTGKAGSGKSTLMKHVYDDERTLEYLTRWSKENFLLTAGFFFWNAGREVQMTGVGLLRTLLYQLLNTQPTLIKQVFSKRWESYQALRGGFYAWTWPELKDALYALCAIDSLRIALFVDGLDEFDGDHEELATFLLQLSGPRTKICAASRPWLVFEDCFESQPSLLLEHLTRKDIQVYVEDAFMSSKHFLRLRRRSESQALDLLEGVVNKSSGVFLWVNLVTSSLLQGMANADRISELNRRLDSLPTDLEALFERLLRSLESFYFSHAAQLVQILKSAPVPPKPLDMSYADEEGSMTAIQAPIEPLAISDQIERVETMRRRLNSRCKGLIAVAQFGNSNLERVEFLHRTVKDFFDKPRIWAEVLEATPESFDVHQCWANSLLMELKTCDTDSGMTVPADLFRLIQWAIQHVEQCDTAAVGRDWQTAYLDEVDKTIKELVLRNKTLKLWSQPEVFSSGTCFLDLVFQHGMIFYVREKLDDDGFEIAEDDLDILLDNVVNSTSPLSSVVAKRILERGGSLERNLSTAPTLTPQMTEIFLEHKKTLSIRPKPQKKLSFGKSWYNRPLPRLPKQAATKIEGFWSL
ncbi:hypothetical protein EJ04DRAFT_564072 [Polyplosphaeria fusca]|uniref:NACHT domain-containing protein n=1 Tax=Polyplosphaeria fusca TaxID=682080 RepID=A0A9P4V1L7_9PLEO|nr:hypothetical protein EJ04DRAFT_564072 [Polyplosphaeria fusca]